MTCLKRLRTAQTFSLFFCIARDVYHAVQDAVAASAGQKVLRVYRCWPRSLWRSASAAQLHCAAHRRTKHACRHAACVSVRLPGSELQGRCNCRYKVAALWLQSPSRAPAYAQFVQPRLLLNVWLRLHRDCSGGLCLRSGSRQAGQCSAGQLVTIVAGPPAWRQSVCMRRGGLAASLDVKARGALHVLVERARATLRISRGPLHLTKHRRLSVHNTSPNRWRLCRKHQRSAIVAS